MKRLYNTVSLLMVALFVFSTMSFMGCTKRPNAEQLQALDEQKKCCSSSRKYFGGEKKRKKRATKQAESKKKRTTSNKRRIRNS